MPLLSNAENFADKARELPGFSNLSLPGLRAQVAIMLGLIGREGIFSTYTRHDISHIDAMLGMLDWLVPQETQRIMTPLDWLLIVLVWVLPTTTHHNLKLTTKTSRLYPDSG